MSRVATQFTPDDLLNLPDDVNYELVNGNLVERNMGGTSSWVAMNIGALLVAFCKKTGAGWIFGTDAGYQCFAFPDTVRKPDVSFIRKGRLPGDRTPDGYIKVPPDLAVEVLSPRDLVYDVEKKVMQYLSAGVLEVWVVNPETRTVRVHRSDGRIEGLGEGDVISGGQLLPGFSCAIKEFFNQ